MDTIRLTMSQALVKFLNAQYVEFDDGKKESLMKGIFTIFGHGNVMGLGQALQENPGKLEVYQGRNEQGMAHAAIAFAKQKHRKQVIACTSSVGPGSANMVTAAATATANQIPLLLFPSDVFATRQPDPALQQIEQTYDLSLSTNDAFRAVSKYWDRVTRPEQLMSAMISAMRVLTNQADTGAVTISLPQDVQGEAWDYPLSFFQERTHYLDRRQPSTRSIQEAAKLIRKKKKPFLILGGGVRYSEAADEFLQFAERFNIPFSETQAGKSCVETTHPLNVGGLGVTGNSAANELAQEADLIIGVGTRFTDFTTASKRLYAHSDVLTINLSDYHASKLDATKMIADAKLALLALMEELEDYQTTYRTEIKEAKNRWEQELHRLRHIQYTESNFIPEIKNHFDHELKEYQEQLNSTLPQTTVLGHLNEWIPSDAIITCAAGSLPGDLQRMWISKERNTYHLEYGYSCMGYEIASAFGVKMAEPNKEVYALTGDGSYLMLHSELVTSIQEGYKINIILFDNSGFGCINNLQMSHGMDSFATEFRKRNKVTGLLDGEIMRINYAQSARGYGAKTYEVHTLDELKGAIEDAKKQTVSTLIDVKVLPKTMTAGYGESWWHVGIAQVSENERINIVYEEKERQLKQARKY
ncbi:3D-(3,5/4)-trihydroxycyclohexane-1,2-dione acylhydrolase (decyclizing) [Bacillus sp. NPDC093026]|uniref:3D-(3,5/4)-trihydroxycyclohexane-1,2-dione acylhydrolase (decyclizing) n=1 Tax=Bacillus sp. NPDC093026 TaxID=3363948 RepID=UPI0038155D84